MSAALTMPIVLKVSAASKITVRSDFLKLVDNGVSGREDCIPKWCKEITMTEVNNWAKENT